MTQKTKPFLQLFQDMVQHFDLDELRALSFSLTIDWDQLAGDNLPFKVISLITYLARRKRLGELLVRLREERPAVPWPDIDPQILADFDAESFLTGQGINRQQSTTSKNTVRVSGGGVIKIRESIIQKNDKQKSNENSVEADTGGELEAGYLSQQNRKV